MIAGNTAIRDIEKEGLGETNKMTLSMDDHVQSHIVKVLTENYKYPLESTIREAASNAYDSHIMSNKIDTPFHVKLYRNQTGDYNLDIEDFGLGLDEEGFNKYYMKLGNSTKRGVAGVLGFYGCGCKAALSYTDKYEVVCRKDGWERKFLIFKGEEYPESTKIYEKETTESNGVLVRTVVGRWDYSEARNAIKEQLCYFPIAFIQIEGDNFNYNEAKIFENDLFSWSEIYPDRELHINFGKVRYPIDFKILKINPIHIPVGIKINPDGVINPFFNRESLEYTKEAKDIILGKIKEVANYFVSKYNEQLPDEYDLLDVFRNINETEKYITLADTTFTINELIPYSDISLKELKIKGINIKTPKFYYDLRSDLLDEYETLVDYNRGKWGIKHVKTNHNYNDLLIGVKHIEVDKIPTGNVKKYLLNKYRDNRVLFIKKSNTRRLGSVYNTKWDSIDYRNVLNLAMELDPITKKTDKSKFRPLIQEWQFVENQFKSLIINESWVEETKSYQEWLAKHKEQQKNNRKSGIYSGNHKVLNKQKGEVTLGMVVSKEIGSGYKIDKQTFKIEEFHRIPKITICFGEVQKDRAKNFYNLLNKKFNVCVVGKNEFNKIKDKHNIMTEKQWKDSKSFKRIMTSVKYGDLIKEFDTLFDRDDIEIIKDLVSPLYKDVQILQNYKDKNGKRINNDILDELLAAAEEHNLYDYEFSDIYNRVKEGIKKYEFINLIEKPNSWNEKSKKKVKTLIGQLLYHQKMYHNLHENIEIELKPIVKEEEPILEEQLETA